MSENSFCSTRRDFLKSLGISVPIIGIGGISLYGCTKEKKVSHSELFQLFKNPIPESRPFFRWWWNGNCITKEEISREIKLMSQAGAGGVEINPIAMPQQINDPPPGGKTWLSETWCEMVRFTVEEAQKNNMITDLIVGTGWPFGGEFLEPDETIQGLTTEDIVANGPGSKIITVEETQENEEISKIYLVPSGFREMDEIVELDQRPDPNNQFSIKISQNEYHVVIIRIKKGFREVFRGAPGGAGPVLDHFNAVAVSKYLNHMSDKLNPYFEGKLGNGIRAVFCDSIELEGANWTSDFPSEFEKRRGYSVHPYLPLLMTEMEVAPDLVDKIQQARYDYSLTLAELFKERFIEVFHHWCQNNGVLSRYQAYGHPWLYTDLVNGYMIPDIPEGDQWLYNSGWSTSRINEIRYAIWNKYASSGGHLANRSIISSEAMTNTSGVFKATLKYMKQAADLNFVAGINHLVLHGFNYSPPDQIFPGWIQYGTYFNENNTWWPYVSKFMDYVSRFSVVLQCSEPVSQVAILGPTTDIWRKYGLDRNPFNTSPWYLHSIWQALSSFGISTDYVNGRIITEATFKNGNLHYKNMRYQALVVCDTESLELPVARSILQYVEGGGKVIFLNKYPEKSPGMNNSQEFDALVKSSINRAIDIGAHVEKEPDAELINNMDGLAQWAGQFIQNNQLEPGILINNPDAFLLSAQFKKNQYPILFFSNVHRSRHIRTEISVPEDSYDYWKWHPENGEKEKLSQKNNHGIQLNLKPLESALVVLDKPTFNKRSDLHIHSNKELIINGNWELECIPRIDGTIIKKTLNQLYDLSSFQDLRYFSGTSIYRRSIELKDSNFSSLDIGSVYDLAEVFLNGKSLGIDWYGNNSFSIKDYLVAGKNELEIKVINTLFNYCLSQKDNPEINYWLERSKEDLTPLPSGLIGPVKLVG